ncbi:MAG: ATP-dependent Clp protease proteolytic subunit [Maricaulis sp.]|nr:ATP-dependent Clp protease proteolytic subunit [Maricaulis sp.]
MDRDNFMSAQESVEFGLIDKVIEKRPDDESAEKKK